MKTSVVKVIGLFATSILATNAFAIANETTDEVSEAYQQFSFDLFDQVEQKSSDGNVIISPLSAWYALGMLQEGAASTTFSGINQTLRLAENFTDLAPYNQQLTYQVLAPSVWEEWLDDEDRPMLELANSFWADDQITCYEEYKQTLQDYYFAEYRQVDLQQQASLDLVDEWVNEKTHGTIPSLKLTPDDMMRMLLVNALYFKAGWGETMFDPELTEEHPFTTSSGVTKQVPMMFAATGLKYAELEGFQIVRLHFGINRRFSMTFFIDKQSASVLDKAVYSAVKTALTYKDVKLRLPRFKSDCEVVLNDPLKAMGMGEAFTVRADFSRISSAELLVTLIKQLTHIGVDENGVEASAATVITMESSGIGDEPDPEGIELNIDHPFYFTIEDNDCDKLLFLGHISDLGTEEGSNALNALTLPREDIIYDMMGHRKAGVTKGLNIVNTSAGKKIIYVPQSN